MRYPGGTREGIMKRFIIGILLLAILTMLLTGCVSKETFEKVQQDLSTAEATMASQRVQIAELSSELGSANEALETEKGRSAELASSLEQTGAELEDTQAALQDTRVQLVDVREQLGAISETPFGLYYVIDTPAGQQLEDLPAESDEVLADGYILITNYDDVGPRHATRDATLGHWMLMATTSPGVEVDRDVFTGLITGSNLYSKEVAIGSQEIKEKWGGTWSAEHFGSKLWVRVPCTWKLGLGWVTDYPIRVLGHPLVEYLTNDVYGHHITAQFEELEKAKQVMTLALDPELIVQARESAVEAGVDFEVWLTEAILAKIK